MQKILVRLFYADFALLWGWIFLNSVLRWQHNSLAALGLGLVLVGGLYAVARWLLPRLNSLSRKQWKAGFFALFTVYAALFCRLSWLLAEIPIMDHEAILKSLPDLLQNGHFTVWSGYYIVCNNNLGTALVLGLWYKLFSLFGFGPGLDLMGVMPGIVLNDIAILGSVALVCLLARRIFSSNRAVALAFILCVGFAPFLLYSPFFYSDTLSLPFALLCLLGFNSLHRAKTVKKQALCLVGMGAAAFFGFAVKGSVAVMLVAVVIQLFLEYKPKKALAFALVMVLCFGGLVGGYKLLQRSYMIDWADEEMLTLPITLWFCYGSHDEGNYSQADVDAVMAVDTIAQREEIIAQRIRDNYASYTPGQLFRFMTRKAAITWGNGMYDAQEFLETPQRSSWTHFFTVPGQPGFMPVVYYCQAVLYAVQLLVLLFLAGQIKQANANTLTLAGIGVLGLVIFLSFWETKARYAFHFTPLLLLLALGGLLWLCKENPRET